MDKVVVHELVKSILHAVQMLLVFFVKNADKLAYHCYLNTMLCRQPINLAPSEKRLHRSVF